MDKVLVLIDPDSAARTREAVAKAISLCAQHGAALHLLSVQPRVSSHVAMCFAKGELRQLQERTGLEELAAAQAQVQAAGLPCTAYVRVGRRAETIARVARELQCATVVMGAQAGTTVGGLFGSVAAQVRHMMGAGANCQVIG